MISKQGSVKPQSISSGKQPLLIWSVSMMPQIQGPGQVP